MSEAKKKESSVIRELNAITLGALRELADSVDANHLLNVQFGITKRTADAIRRLTIDDIWRVVDQIGETFLFSARNADDTLFQLIRSGVAENDVFVLAKLRSVAAAKFSLG